MTAGSNPGILITITQNGSQNRMVISARPDSGGETVFYDGYFQFRAGVFHRRGRARRRAISPARDRRSRFAWISTKTAGSSRSTASSSSARRTPSPPARTFRATTSARFSATGTPRSGHGVLETRHLSLAANNTWSPFTKSIFTAATGALSGTGATPSPMDLRYVIASDPGLPDPLPAGPTRPCGGLPAVEPSI